MFLAAIVEKAFEPFYRLKADDVIMQHRGDEPLVMRERNEQAGRRPGNVQEQPDAIPQAVRGKPFAKRQEMKILHPDDGLLTTSRIRSYRELLVDPVKTAAEPMLIFHHV